MLVPVAPELVAAAEVPPDVTQTLRTHPAFQNMPEVAVTEVEIYKTDGSWEYRRRYTNISRNGPFTVFDLIDNMGTPAQWFGKTSGIETFLAGHGLGGSTVKITYFRGDYDHKSNLDSRIISIDHIVGRLFPLKSGNRLLVEYTQEVIDRQPRYTSTNGYRRWVTWQVMPPQRASTFDRLAKFWPNAPGNVYPIRITTRYINITNEEKKTTSEWTVYYSDALVWDFRSGKDIPSLVKLRWDDAIVKRNLARLGISTASGQASTGSVGDPFQQGFRAYKAKNYKLALHYWAPLVRAGDVRAQLYVGFIYYRGLGVERNGKVAAALFGKAAKGRDPSAEMWLGVMFYNGDTVRKDKKKGIDLLFRAVRQGSNGAKGFAIKYTQKLLRGRFERG